MRWNQGSCFDESAPDANRCIEALLFRFEIESLGLPLDDFFLFRFRLGDLFMLQNLEFDGTTILKNDLRWNSVANLCSLNFLSKGWKTSYLDDAVCDVIRFRGRVILVDFDIEY